MSTVLTLGTFDTPHPGHVALFRECRKLAGGGFVAVAVNTDEFVERFKFRAPVMSYAERAAVVGAFQFVDEVVANDGADQAALIARVAPDLIVVGMDWAGKDYYGQLGITPAWLAERGISLAYVAHEFSTAISSTRIRNRLGLS